ncbi:hypothetical protein evm_006816 [Chilo suppressalis]|nr:hypothetical protein evm_006816 [Chilo suppressalis]
MHNVNIQVFTSAGTPECNPSFFFAIELVLKVIEMSIVLKTGFVSVTHNIKFQPQTVFKGKLLVLAGHVRDVEELRTKQGQSSIIHALIIRQTSITLPPYKTVLNVNTALMRLINDIKM